MNKILKLFLSLIMILSIITFSSIVVLADDEDDTSASEEDFINEANSSVAKWISYLNGQNITIQRQWENERYAFYPILDTISNMSKYGLTYDKDSNGSFGIYYQAENGGPRVKVDVGGTINLHYSFRDEDGDHNGDITVDVSGINPSDSGVIYLKPFSGQKEPDKEVTLTFPGHTGESHYMVSIGGKKPVVPVDWLAENSGTKIRIRAQVTGQPEQTTNEIGTSEEVHGESIWDVGLRFFVSIVEGFANIGLNILAKIINLVVYGIGKGLHLLINDVLHEDLTIGKIVYGQTNRFSIDFWNISSVNDGKFNIARSLKDIVSYWYNTFRGLGITVYLIMLLFIGIKVLLSSTGKGLQEAKTKLTSWFTGVLILLFFPLIMRYSIELNNSLVTMISQASGDASSDIMNSVADSAINDGILILSIVYVIMVGQLLILIMNYYKRAFMVSYLIVIFPIVATYYIWEKSQKGRSKSTRKLDKRIYNISIYTISACYCICGFN